MARASITPQEIASGVAEELDAATTLVVADGVKIATDNTRNLAVLLTAPAREVEVQTVTLTGFDGTDSFKLTAEGNETVAFVRGTNATAAAIQAALRTATGDTGLTVTGTTDEGPFTVTFAEYGDQGAITVTSPSGCTGAVVETNKGVAEEVVVTVSKGDAPTAFSASNADTEITLGHGDRFALALDSAAFLQTDGSIYIDADEPCDIQVVRLP